jgi:hypothetical protein
MRARDEKRGSHADDGESKRDNKYFGPIFKQLRFVDHRLRT